MSSKQTKRSGNGVSALFALFGVSAFVLHLMGNGWQFTGNNLLLCVIFAYCVYLHFRVAHLEKGTAPVDRPE